MKFNVAAAHYVGSVRETGPPTKAYSRWLFPAQILSWSFMFENQGPKIFMFFFVSSTLIMWEHRSDPIGTCLNLFNFQGFFGK